MHHELLLTNTMSSWPENMGSCGVRVLVKFQIYINKKASGQFRDFYFAVLVISLIFFKIQDFAFQVKTFTCAFL